MNLSLPAPQPRFLAINPAERPLGRLPKPPTEHVFVFHRRWVETSASREWGPKAVWGDFMDVINEVTSEQRGAARTIAMEYEPNGNAETEAALLGALTQAQDDLHYQELLIHEANHRTKNALQLIIGGLSVQANRAADVIIRDALEAAISRIRQINEVHTLVAYRTSPDVVDLYLYLQRLSLGIAGSFASQHVTIRVDLETDVAWKREIVVPLGLVVVEALTNSFKYAFPDGRNGQICIKMRVQHNGLMRLQIEDDGVGMPVELRSGALGLGLIERLARRLKGEATFSARSDGTVVRVIFPNPDSVGP
jgi:two-component sensor histidine kinase